MQPGTRLSHYEVAGLIGKGGMGEVYRARDTRLDRDVALKVLPVEFAADAERLVRFEREAKVLASLHHPNIASIFGFEATDSCTFLAMELVAGEDLSEVLKRGPVPVDEAVDIARQIAEGLEEAHEKGIIHRDLKPANVKRTPDGKVKVLDFGLARAFAGQTAGEEAVSSAPTMTAAMTQVGTVLGTAGYMSPEQARGKEVDRRTDIWAFGIILFEMLTGKQTFVGETASDTLAGILKSEPDWDALPKEMPHQVERVLRRCLAKDPRQRLRDIGEARVRLEDPTAESTLLSGPMAVLDDVDVAKGRWLPWGLFAVAAIAAVILGLGRGGGHVPAPDPVPYRFGLEIAGYGSVPYISPDGRRFAYQADYEGENVLWVRSFAETEGRPLKGTRPNGRTSVFWSPDGTRIGYFTEDGLAMVPADGGSAQELATVPSGWRAGSWSARDEILIEVMVNPEAEGWYLYRIVDGSLTKIERPLKLETGQNRAVPTFLPDGEHFVFVHQINGVRQAILTSLGSTETEVLFPTDTRVLVAADGWYVFSRKGQLLALAFDPATWQPVGDVRVVTDEVGLFMPNAGLMAKVADQGTIIYQHFTAGKVITWFDSDGVEIATAIPQGDYRDCSLSPDGRYLALVVNDARTGTGDLWVHDFTRGLRNRLTTSEWAEFRPVWSPEGRRIAFSADPHGPPNLFVIDTDGGEQVEIAPFDGNVHYPTGWTPDGETILFQRTAVGSASQSMTVPAIGGEPQLLVDTPSFDVDAVVSPDGRWLAYVTGQTGRPEVYVRPFPGNSRSERISVEGGRAPRWSGAGDLYYQGLEDNIMVVDLTDNGERLEIGVPHEVLRLPNSDLMNFGLHPDGRIMVMQDTDDQNVGRSQVIVGWQ